MVRNSAFPLIVLCVACLPPSLGAAETLPAYRIILRSRSGEVTPERDKDGTTSGGYIEVVQRDPDTVLIFLRGSVVAVARKHQGGSAAMRFLLNQDFEIVPTRPGVLPPRLILSGQVIGTLQSSLKCGGSAAQGPACASVSCAGQPILEFCSQPHSVGTGERLFVNDRQGPFERTVPPAGYCLRATFELSTQQPWAHCCPADTATAAIYEPEPALQAPWSGVLRVFRAVPHRDFGFGVVLRVVEDVPPGVKKLEEEPLPKPRPVAPSKPSSAEVRILHQ